MEPVKNYFCVESDGTCDGTRITNPDGEVIGLVQHMRIELDCQKKYVTAVITVLDIPLRLAIESSNVAVNHVLLPKEEDENA